MSEITKEQIEKETQSFAMEMLPFGYLDIQAAVDHALNVNMYGYDLAKTVNDYLEEANITLENADVCYIILDYILQQARNKISEVLGLDICNDLCNGTEYTVYGNAMCSSIDYSTENQKELQFRINEATPEQKLKLRKDVMVKYFAELTDIDLPSLPILI